MRVKLFYIYVCFRYMRHKADQLYKVKEFGSYYVFLFFYSAHDHGARDPQRSGLLSQAASLLSRGRAQPFTQTTS